MLLKMSEILEDTLLMLKHRQIEKELHLLAKYVFPVSHASQQVKGQSKCIKDESRKAAVNEMALRKRLCILILASLLFAGELGILKYTIETQVNLILI